MQEEDPQFTKTLLSQSRDDVERGDDKDAPAEADATGETVEPGEFIGRYKIRERIGEGGMGVVYAAEDRDLGRVVAIKLLHTRYGTEAEQQQHRLLREAQALARVSHRNLVMVFDVGSLDGRVWIAMEYVAGDTLEQWMNREHRTWAEIVGVLGEAARGLAAVHSAGLVHRDFKPGNVIVRKDGTVQVLDFGLAVRMGEHEEEQSSAPPDLDALAANLTTTGAFMGTPAYMAPEQFMMRPTDGRTDQFALCVVLYEALYGHRPFKGRDIAELMGRTLEGLPALPPEMPGLPLAVRQVIARGLARDPDDRFPDMAALVSALEHTRAPERTTSGGWRRFALGMFAGSAVLAVAVGVWLYGSDDEATVVSPTIVTPAAASETKTPPPKKSQRPAPPVEPAKTQPVAPPVDAPPIEEPAIEEPAVEEPPTHVATPSGSSQGHALPKPRDEPATPRAEPSATGLPSVRDGDEPDDPPPSDDESDEPKTPPAEPGVERPSKSDDPEPEPETPSEPDTAE